MTIKCKNMTHAMKGTKILKQAGIEASVQKITTSKTSGCIYVIEFSGRYQSGALTLLKQNHIQFHKSETLHLGE